MNAEHFNPEAPVPGVYHGVPMAQYLAANALSSTPLRKFAEECPRSGWYASRLNPNRPDRETSDGMDVGTLAHEMLLEGSQDRLEVIDPLDHPSSTTGSIPDGWTNKSIKAARDHARSLGRCPVFPAVAVAIRAMHAEALAYIASLDDEPHIRAMMQPDGGHSEVTMIWDDGGVLCKIRHDRLSLDNRISLDVKTSKRSAEPDRFARTGFVGMGYAFNAAFYRRGVRALCGVDCESVFLVQETEPPYLCSLPGLDMAWKQTGDARVAAAIKGWRECARSGKWPGYPSRCVYPEMPAWEMARAEAEAGEGEEHAIPYDYADLTGRPKVI